jgi:hypothetical protein
MRLHVIVIAVLVLFTALTHAEVDPTTQLHAARSLRCHFGPGTSTEWTGSKPKTSIARFDQDVQFDSIDIKNHSARIIGNLGASDIKVFVTEVGISFLETAPAVFDVTTVFPVYGEDHDFIAVDTRHVTSVGKAMAEQYYGICKISQ